MADRSTIGEIVTALRLELATFLGFGERVFVSARKEPPHFLADADVVIRMGGEGPGRAVVSGAGGRVVNQRVRKVILSARTRCQLDPPDRDTVHLLGTSGHLALEDQIHDCLEMWLPASAERGLLEEPARCGTWSEPVPEVKHPEWLTSTLEIELPYLRELDLTRGV